MSYLLTEPLTRTSPAEGIQFWILATIAVIGALGVVGAARAVYSALCLATTMIVLALMYIAQDALFLGIAQVVVYTGAVMMLFVFVLMLVGVDSSDSLVETLRGQRFAALVAGLGLGLLLIGGIVEARRPEFAGLASSTDGNLTALSALIFIRYVWAFELTGALLIAATLGAMVLTHQERFTARKTQRELSQERFRGLAEGEPLAQLPTPGVYAHGNAADLPAQLPDGTQIATVPAQRRPARFRHTPGKGKPALEREGTQ